MESFDPTISKEAYALAARLIEEFDKMEVMVQGYVYVPLYLLHYPISGSNLFYIYYLHLIIAFHGYKISTVKHAKNKVPGMDDFASL